MDLLSVLLKAFLSDKAIKALAKKTGIDSKSIKKFLPLAVPFLIKMLTKNASSKEGASSLLEALTQHTGSDTLEKQIEEADTTDGAKIIGHIFGSKKDEDLQLLSDESDLDKNSVSGILSTIAPSVLTALSAATKSSKKSGKKSKVDLSDGLDLSDVVAMLGGDMPDVGDVIGGLLGDGSVSGKKSRKKDDSTNGLSLLSSLLGF